MESSQKHTPVYNHSFQEAVVRGESEQFRASRELNMECARAINAAMEKYYDPITYEWNTEPAARDVIEKFGSERTMAVLAHTVQHYSWDGRFSNTSRDWARTMPRLDKQAACLVTANAGWLDSFVQDVCYDYQLKQPLKASEIKAEAKHVLKGFQSMSRNRSPDMTHMKILLSPGFSGRATPEDYDKLTKMLPFSSLTISRHSNREEPYGVPYAVARISADENPDRHLRKPSIKAQLAIKPVPGDKPAAKHKEREVR